MKNLLTELRAQFSIREWLDAMKQGIKELFNQWSVREWIAAFLFYVPTAHCTSVKPGAKLLHAGGTSTEIYNALVKMKSCR